MNVRVALSNSSDTLGYRIRQAHHQKIPYVLIIGEQEMKNQNISVRVRKGGQKNGISFVDFTKQIKKLISQKSFDL